MKTLKMITLGIMMFFASSSINAQISVNVNLGLQPSWGPVGYSSVDYYYIPDVQSYYDVRTTQFIYLSNGAWIRSSRLPNQYRNYDLNRGYKVVLNDYHGSRPYDNYRNDRVKYYKGYKGKPQQSLGYRNHKSDNHGNYKSNGNHGNNGKSNNHGNKGNNGKGNNGKGH
ncbi:MAG: hypothetical protein C0412_04570 [Flavobacterium sp.]|nr:hypothetical protein [Flavobacterium sp.]